MTAAKKCCVAAFSLDAALQHCYYVFQDQSSSRATATLIATQSNEKTRINYSRHSTE